ncbi:MAG TPA: M56 family metallopeptidase [Prolixibacteraceae bacterium]|nr:M56 family metallopeptidase [Prolixibacteraceae bacterium]
MGEILLYLLKSTLCMSVLYLVFRALMRKHTFFQLNRVILLSIVMFSIVIPLVHLPQALQPAISFQLPPIANQLDVDYTKLPAAVIATENEVVGQPVETTSLKFAISWPKLLQMSYLSGLFVAFLASLIGFLHILILFRKVPVINNDGYWLHIAQDDIPAFSFGRYLFISKSDFDTNGETILTHEKAHIRHVHFYDLLFLEVVKIVYWFNPVIYYLIRDLKAVHEFQADDSTLNNGIDATKYQLLIIQKCVGHQKFALANSFNHCQIKNRIVMMNKQKSQKAWRWMAAAFIPMLALLLMAFGRTGQNVPPERNALISLEKALPQKTVGKISEIDNAVSLDSAVVSQDKKIPPPPPPPPFNIEIRKEGIFVSDKLYSLEEFIEKAKLYQKNYPGRDILLLVDNSISHSRVDEIREALENAEVYHVNQSTLKKSDGIIYPAGDVTESAKFSNGNWGIWMQNQLKHFSEGKPKSWECQITYSFVIDKNGKATDGHIIKGCDYPEINTAVEQILTQIPDWKPAKRMGNAVTVLYKEIITMRSVEKE